VADRRIVPVPPRRDGRMSNADVTELYDLVDVGAVIISRQ
jgi:hypothetical protein